MNVDAEGGKKKKKKRKAWSTKKKTKHKHRKIKLLTLKLYQVDKNGAVSRTHKQCPVCPGGVYMGKHFDRHYCGTCHQTLRMDEATVRSVVRYCVDQSQLGGTEEAAEGERRSWSGRGRRCGQERREEGRQEGEEEVIMARKSTLIVKYLTPARCWS